jgi:hypothetical protein
VADIQEKNGVKREAVPDNRLQNQGIAVWWRQPPKSGEGLAEISEKFEAKTIRHTGGSRNDGNVSMPIATACQPCFSQPATRPAK